MSGYLANLAARALNPARTLRPELPAIFAAPKFTTDSPFETEVFSPAAAAEPGSNAAQKRPHLRPDLPPEAGEFQTMESEWKPATNPGNRGARPFPAQPNAAQPGSMEDVEITSSPAAPPAKRAALPSRPAVLSPAAKPETISASGDPQPVSVKKRTRESSQHMDAARGEETAMSPTPQEQDADATRFAPPVSGRLFHDVSSHIVGRDLDFGRDLDSPPTAREDNILRIPAPAAGKTSKPVERTPPTVFADAIPKSLTASDTAEIPEQLRSLGQASTPTPRSSSRSEPAVEPAIQVTIGRIEVRAPSNQASSRAASRAAQNGPTLEEYLRARSPRGRG